ncbi:uncharacterized protein HMPREF1541_03368 [Cyphellophora europaea CBS 101466]|uniref:Amidohydrolase-related domain-containing protein n=1 Tax=Cyphellophora europaea (strain CBS 101466) TaxID=1220924 RepID=W2RYC8_CYPE1|nr:uncharacterized protein HMPREF1541_03368 [Cyphellophora europaea CBS 101466]ETN41432.1 hypothetical protein HMPREF1541_03368 [Cyphellophora europaea CBS 101466]
MTSPLITLEEHFLAATFTDDPSGDDKYTEQLKHIPGLSEKLTDLDNIRIHHMDAGHVSFQVISHCPGAKTVAQCRAANDQLAHAIEKHPERFAGFAALDVSVPAAAAAELRRCVTELGFRGTLVDSHTPEGAYFDGPAYDVLWEAAQQLDVPIYIHPTWATDEQIQLLYAGETIPQAATTSMSSSGFGWHADVATHFLRLFAAGVFDRFPKLKIILGHFGETLPFMVERVGALSKRWGTYTRDFRQVWRENVWVTTSGVWGLAPMACLLRNTSVRRILYSVDYPFAKNEDGLTWWGELVDSGLLSEDALELVAHGNAEELLGVKATHRYD